MGLSGEGGGTWEREGVCWNGGPVGKIQLNFFVGGNWKCNGRLEGGGWGDMCALGGGGHASVEGLVKGLVKGLNQGQLCCWFFLWCVWGGGGGRHGVVCWVGWLTVSAGGGGGTAF